MALLDSRDFVTPDDIKQIASPPCAIASRSHRSLRLKGFMQTKSCAASSMVSRRHAVTTMPEPTALDSSAPDPTALEPASLDGGALVAYPLGSRGLCSMGHLGARRLDLGCPGGSLVGVGRGAAAGHGCRCRRRSSDSIHSLKRTVPQALSVNEWQDVVVRLENPSRRTLTIEVTDASPTAFHSEGIPRTVEVEANKWLEFTWRLRPTARGMFSIPWMEIRLMGPFGLIRERRRVAVADSVRVYPNFKAVSRFALLATDNRVAELGVHTRRRRGQGLEFMQLREYREGDPLRQID